MIRDNSNELNDYTDDEEVYNDLKQQMKDKTLYIPSKFNIESPILSKASNNLSEELEKFALKNKNKHLSYTEMIMYSISAYSKMAALVIFK